MEKRKRNIIIISVVAILVILLVCLIIFFSCSQTKDNEKTKTQETEETISHTHEYTLNYDSYYHWKECSCGDIIDKEEHTFGDYSTETGISYCTCEGCGATKGQVWTESELINYVSSENCPTILVIKYDIEINQTITISTDVILDLNEKTLTFTDCSVAIEIDDGGNLKITGGGTIKHTPTSVYGKTIYVDGGTLTIDDAKINIIGDATYSNAIYVQSGNVVIQDGSISCSDSMGNYVGATSLISLSVDDGTATVYIISGTFVSFDPENSGFSNITIASGYSISTTTRNSITTYLVE